MLIKRLNLFWVHFVSCLGIYRWTLSLFFLLSLNLLVSCQTVPPQTTKQAYLEFEEGIRQLSHDLMTKLYQKTSIFSGSSIVVSSPFLDVDNGQVLQTSLDIEALFINETHQHFKKFQISRITPEKLADARYILNGIIKYEANKSQPKNQPENKYYQVSASIVDLKTTELVTKGTIRIKSPGLNYQPTPSYEDNPMYIKGNLLTYVTKTLGKPVGSQIDPSYYTFIKTKALLVAAQTAYDKNNYEQARQLFQEVTQRPDGKIIEAYGGLYAIYFKQNNLEKAEESFGKMVTISVENGIIPIKVLFKTDLTTFLEIPELRQQYTIWLRQISLYFKNHSEKCVNIIGHTSQSGSYAYNKRLSKQRAKKIQDTMRQTFPGIVHRSEIIGKGSDETIIGTVPDSAENAIDRRVEFKIVDC